MYSVIPPTTHLLVLCAHCRPRLSSLLAQPDLHISFTDPLLLRLPLQSLILPQFTHVSKEPSDRSGRLSFLFRVPDVRPELGPVRGRACEVGVRQRSREDRVESFELGRGERVVVFRVERLVGLLCGFTLLYVGLRKGRTGVVRDSGVSDPSEWNCALKAL